ncbi:MAG: type III-A CRISPR-associated protein Csm2 [Bacteroidetes bacterium]|nr:type III-A CRISPR-associated protein Csm2 [Bacteroidota bacterium]
MEIPDFGKITPEELNQLANEKGKAFNNSRDRNKRSNNVSSSQLRNFFSAVSSIKQMSKAKKGEEILKRELILLKPKLAYAAGRDKNNIKEYSLFMIDVIDKTVSSGNFHAAIENFFAFMEAVIAYHKFYSDKD